VRREQPLQQQLSAVSALLVAAPAMVNTKEQELAKTKKWGTGRIFLFYSENSYVSSE
jgi:hypothetical protein